MKFAVSAFVAIFFAGVIHGTALAAPPTLTAIHPDSYTQETHPGDALTFEVMYNDADGDAPQSVDLVLDTPGGQVKETAAIPPGNPTEGIPIQWSYTPQNSGVYRMHFEAVSVTGQSARLPADPTAEFEFASVNPWTNVFIFVVGLVIALIVLPFVVYIAARSINRQGDPAAAARIGLLLGVLASLALYIYLFASDYGALGIALACIAAVAVLIVLFSRRRTV